MEALDKIRDYNLDSNTVSHLDDTLDNYKMYLKKLSGLAPFHRKMFLSTLERNEIINNQEMEHENPFLVQLSLASENGVKKSSIAVMTDSIINNQPLTIRKLQQLHRLIIRGSEDDIERNYPIRYFDTYVYEVINGRDKVSYFAPSPEEIRLYLKDMIKFLSESGKEEKDVLLNSIILHFYISALQPFGNGNTRLARLVEYGSIFKLSRDILGFKIKAPALYASASYLQTRKMYRDSIADLVNYPNDDSFNKFVNYNLNTMDEQLYFNNNVLDKKIKRGF